MNALSLGPAALFREESNLDGPPIQFPLFVELQKWEPWAIRLHHATSLHYDLRFKHCGTLLSFVLYEVPSLDPAKSVLAKQMPDHDPRYLLSERKIPKGSPGAGPTMAVDTGGYAPVLRQYSTHDLEMICQLAGADVHLELTGTFLKGGWRLCRSGDDWRFQKVADEHASNTRLLTLDKSIRTGKSLGDLR